MEVLFRIFTDFPLGIMLAELLFSYYYPKRSHFFLRVCLLIPFCIIYAVIANGAGSDSSGSLLLDRLLIITVMALTALWLYFCRICSLNELLFCIIAAYAVQNIHHNLSVNGRILIETLSGISLAPWMDAVLSVLLMVLVYSAAAFLLVPRLSDADISHVDRPRMLINGLFFLLMTVFFVPDLPETRVLNFLYYLAADGLALFVLFGLLKESRQSKELMILEQLLHAEDRQRKTTKETIDIINMKCHDLKHQISLLRQGGNDEFVKEIENAVQIYDSSLKTGNETLDIILMEKLLHCEKHEIELTCIADGEKLNFMSSSDIYSLFGNALDNAIDSVSKEEDPEKRVISFQISARDHLLKMRVENYLEKELVLKDGLPVTTKDDKKYHGFSMMSIRHIVRKYGGEMSVSTDHHAFVLTILIPIEV